MFIYCLITLFPQLYARKWTQLLQDLKNGGNEWEKGRVFIAQTAWPHLSARFQLSTYFERKKLEFDWPPHHRYAIQMCPIAAQHVCGCGRLDDGDKEAVWTKEWRLSGNLMLFCVIRDTSNAFRAKEYSPNPASRDVKTCWVIWQPKVPILNARGNS